jgi:acetate CoA/acetoacetate CoA-transferase alpha subunit
MYPDPAAPCDGSIDCELASFRRLNTPSVLRGIKLELYQITLPKSPYVFLVNKHFHAGVGFSMHVRMRGFAIAAAAARPGRDRIFRRESGNRPTEGTADESTRRQNTARYKGRGTMRTLPLDQTVAMIPDGASLMIGGFMSIGTPERIIDEIVRQRKRDLTVIANDTAMPGKGIGKLVEAGLLRRAIVSHIGLNPQTQRMMIAGEVEVELVPQGTLIERIRAAGHGLGGILTQTGIGTPVEKGKQRIKVDGKDYLLEIPLRADFALVQAFIADYLGNLGYALTARNFNPVIAMAAATVIASAEHIVPVGVIAPDHVVTPAPIVDYLVANP